MSDFASAFKCFHLNMILCLNSNLNKTGRQATNFACLRLKSGNVAKFKRQLIEKLLKLVFLREKPLQNSDVAGGGAVLRKKWWSYFCQLFRLPTYFCQPTFANLLLPTYFCQLIYFSPTFANHLFFTDFCQPFYFSPTFANLFYL